MNFDRSGRCPNKKNKMRDFYISNCELCANLFANWEVFSQFRESLYKQEPFSGWANLQSLKSGDISLPLKCFDMAGAGFFGENVEHRDIVVVFLLEGNQLGSKPLLPRWEQTNQHCLQDESKFTTKSLITKLQNYYRIHRLRVQSNRGANNKNTISDGCGTVGL